MSPNKKKKKIYNKYNYFKYNMPIIDEPKPEKPGMGATSGLNAAPIVANIIRRSGTMLGVKPEFGHESGATVVSYQ